MCACLVHASSSSAWCRSACEGGGDGLPARTCHAGAGSRRRCGAASLRQRRGGPRQQPAPPLGRRAPAAQRRAARQGGHRGRRAAKIGRSRPDRSLHACTCRLSAKRKGINSCSLVDALPGLASRGCHSSRRAAIVPTLSLGVRGLAEVCWCTLHVCAWKQLGQV